MYRVEACCFLYSCDFAVLPGYPAHQTAHLHSMPAVSGGSDMLKHCPIRNGSDTGVIRTITPVGYSPKVKARRKPSGVRSARKTARWGRNARKTCQWHIFSEGRAAAPDKFSAKNGRQPRGSVARSGSDSRTLLRTWGQRPGPCRHHRKNAGDPQDFRSIAQNYRI